MMNANNVTFRNIREVSAAIALSSWIILYHSDNLPLSWSAWSSPLGSLS
jgi:hypothetical protein